MIDLERAKKSFENHIAKLTDYGNIKILDFKRPDSSEYRIRFLFEEDYYRLHISGDLGELIATNYKNMCYESFDDFVHDTGYFETKIDCHSRPLYVYNEEKAREELISYLKENFLYDDLDSEESEFLDNVFVDFDIDKGIGPKGIDALLIEVMDSYDVYVLAENLGKESTGILDLYMLAFELAQEQLKEQK